MACRNVEACGVHLADTELHMARRELSRLLAKKERSLISATCTKETNAPTVASPHVRMDSELIATKLELMSAEKELNRMVSSRIHLVQCREESSTLERRCLESHIKLQRCEDDEYENVMFCFLSELEIVHATQRRNELQEAQARLLNDWKQLERTIASRDADMLREETERMRAYVTAAAAKEHRDAAEERRRVTAEKLNWFIDGNLEAQAYTMTPLDFRSTPNMYYGSSH